MKPDETPDFEVTGWGLVRATVCTSLPDDDATDRLNRQLPTGISSRWELDPEGFTDAPNGVACTERPTHRHLLFLC